MQSDQSARRFQKLNIKNFSEDVLKDYENYLENFFDSESGAILENGRDDGTKRFLYTESTGYAILDLLFLHSITQNDRYIKKAKISANWIKDVALDACGGVKTRYFFENEEHPNLSGTSFHGRRIYSFDTAICLKALVALYNATNDEVYLNLSKRLGDFLFSKMIESSGRVFPVYNAKNDKIVEEDHAVWSKRFGAFHAKVAEALFDLYIVTSDKKYLVTAKNICQAALSFQQPAGNFETSLGLTELHPHCYAAEGLLYVGSNTQNTLFIDAARKAAEWALSQSQSGEIAQSFDLHNNKPITKFRTDALAQTLELAVDLLQVGQLDKKYVNSMDELASKILSMKQVNRYFSYGFYEKDFKGKLESYTQSYWTNAFCLHSLYKYYLTQTLARTRIAILAGGKGARFWPLASETMPKPLSVVLLNNRSLLQETIRRYTFNNFIRPEQIFILCSSTARETTVEQVKIEDIPSENILVEKEPKGTIPAVAIVLDDLKQRMDTEDIFVVSMADDVIDPPESFQRTLIQALFTARENECIVSVGKPIEKTKYDKRFGHMVYFNRINSYCSYQVDKFVEKPTQSEFENLKHLGGDMAWECGTIVFRNSYFRQVIPMLPEKNDLAKHLLSQAANWSLNEKTALRVAVSVLDEKTRFEDLGSPGLNLYQFFRSHPKHDFGSGNICLGRISNVEINNSTNNLVVADKLPIKIYGLDGYLIIDSEWTNTTVIMPFSSVDHLSDLYYIFVDDQQYKPFIIGGPVALQARPITFPENNPQIQSEFGLVLAYNCGEIFVNKRQDCLLIANMQHDLLDLCSLNKSVERSVTVI